MNAERIRRPDRRRPEPLWHQVEASIRRNISDGHWPAGSRIPGEEELTELLGVSRITVRHALATLATAGVLRKEHGRGTFVRTPRLVAGTRTVTSFSDEMAALGVEVRTELLDVGVVSATETVAEVLELDAGDDVVKLRRLRCGNDEPIGVQTALLPVHRVPGLLQEEGLSGSLYELLRQRYGLLPTDATEVFRVGVAPTEDRIVLGIDAGDPVFLVERVTNDDRGPFEFTSSTMRGDRYEIRSSLHSP